MIGREISTLASFFDSVGLSSVRIKFEYKSKNTCEGTVFAKATTTNGHEEN